MATSFVNSIPVGAGAARLRGGTCPVRMSTRTLSPQDKEYLHKVRERLMRSANRKAAQEAARHNVTRVYERPGDEGEEFAAAMRAFNVGQYDTAAELFAAAVRVAGGAATPRGGRVALWLAQALDAAGERCAAVAELEELQVHADPNIASTAAELLFIVTAPKLELPRDAFVELPELGRPEKRYETHHLVSEGLGRLRKKKQIEKYSLEWYAKQPRPSRKELDEGNRDPAGLLLIAGGAAAALAVALRMLPQ